MIKLGVKNKKEKRFYFKLFWATFTLSAFTVGGGYVIVPLMQQKFVHKYGWLSEDQMLDYVAIAQSAPGVIAINVSILVGYGIAGMLGALLTILGTLLPPLIIMTVVSFFYEALKDNVIFKAIMLALGCAVAAVILDAVVSMIIKILKQKDLISILIMVASFILAVLFNVNVIYILISCVILGLILTLLQMRKKGTKS